METLFQKDDGHTRETVLWFEEKHKFLGSENNVMFRFVYIPPNQSKYYDNNSFDQLERDIINFPNSGYSVVLLGDFNAITRSLIDYVETDEDLIERLGLDVNMLSTTTDKTTLGSEILRRHDISISRHSKDKCNNSHGTLFLDVLKNCSLFIMNGRVDRDALIGKATSEEVSLLDHAISSPEIFPIAKDFCVHCARSLELEAENRKENEKDQIDQISVMNCSIETTNMPNIRHDLSSDSINRFKNNPRILEPNISEISNKIDNAVVSSLDYEATVKEFNDILIESASGTFPTNTIMNKQVRKPLTVPICLENKPWFNKECRRKKNKYY